MEVVSEPSNYVVHIDSEVGRHHANLPLFARMKTCKDHGKDLLDAVKSGTF